MCFIVNVLWVQGHSKGLGVGFKISRSEARIEIVGFVRVVCVCVCVWVRTRVPLRRCMPLETTSKLWSSSWSCRLIWTKAKAGVGAGRQRGQADRSSIHMNSIHMGWERVDREDRKTARAKVTRGRVERETETETGGNLKTDRERDVWSVMFNTEGGDGGGREGGREEGREVEPPASETDKGTATPN